MLKSFRVILSLSISLTVGISAFAQDKVEYKDVILNNINANGSPYKDHNALIIVWKNLGNGQFKNVTENVFNVGENITVQKAITLGNNDLVVDTSASDLILPDLNNARNIGTSDLKWRKVYATTFLGNLEGQVSGNVSGKAGSADKLTSATTFRVTGDVETVEQSFDGQTGGGVKEFNLSVKNTIISGKELVNNSLSNDEILIDRTSGDNTGLKRITRQTLFQAIGGLTPIGSIMPYAGNAEPAGWKFCNGQELSTGVFNQLFQLIDYNYKPQIETYFQFRENHSLKIIF